jgi:hypothetical protein
MVERNHTVRKTAVIDALLEDLDIHKSSFFHQPFLVVCHHDRGRVFFLPCGVELVKLPSDGYKGPRTCQRCDFEGDWTAGSMLSLVCSPTWTQPPGFNTR